MRERDRSDEQKGQQHDAQASGTRSLQAIENSYSRSVGGRPLIGQAGVTMGLEKSSVKTIRFADVCILLASHSSTLRHR